MPQAQAASRVACALAALTGANRPAMGAPPKTTRVISSPVEASGTCRISGLHYWGEDPRQAGPRRVAEFLYGFGPQLRRSAGSRRRLVPAADDPRRVGEVLVQVVDPLDHPAVRRAGHRDVVEHCQVLHQLAQPDTARVRADRHAELGRGSRYAMFSLTPATRQASICMMSIAPACRSCLKITRFVTCSPVATRTGRPPGGSARCPGCRPGWWAPRSSRARPRRAPGPRRSRRLHPTPGSRPARCRSPRPPRGRSGTAACRPRAGRPP